MLKYKIKKNNHKNNEVKLDIVNIREYENNSVVFETAFPHGFNNNDEVFFKRINKYNDITIFNDKKYVNIIDKNQFFIESFPQKLVSIEKCEIINIYSPIVDRNVDLLKFTLNENIDILTNKSILINNLDENTEDNIIIKRCAGDYVNYNGVFLVKSTKIENNQYVEFEKKIFNTEGRFIVNNSNEIKNIKFFLPVDENGNDIRKIVYCECAQYDEKIINFILKHYREFEFKYDSNERYFSIERGEFKSDFDGNIDAYIYYYNNEINLFLAHNNNFDTTLLKNEYYTTLYVDEMKKKHINKPIDMEKQIFVPRLKTNVGNTTFDTIVDEIDIKIKLRDRNVSDWENGVITSKGYKNTNPSNLEEIGFTEDDIKYQKNSLSKTFLRLSFYDTPNRATQSLLYYSTIFLNSNKIFNNYINNKENICQFIIKNVFDYFNSSEGYYLYLFPNISKYDIPTTIYMKAEFNHAKYGITIPLLLPSNDKYKNGYVDENYDGIKDLFNDLYIKINIMYDTKTNKYIWYFDKEDVNNITNKKIEMVLYEPIVNQEN